MNCILRTKKEDINAYIEKNRGLVIVYGAASWGALLSECCDFKIDFFCDKKADELRSINNIPVIDIQRLESRINESEKRATIIICVATKRTVMSIYTDLMRLDLNADVFDYFENEIAFSDSKFTFSGKEYMLFEHPYNCGYIHTRMTERCVELALAKEYIDSCEEQLVEIGAVTPYYFYDDKIAEIIDPADVHRRVIKKSIFSCDLKEKNVLSISTVEHIGLADYGLNETENAIDAIEKILGEAATCLITAPLGFNSLLDEWVKENQKNPMVKIMKRGINNHWEDITGHYIPIEYTQLWANGLVIIEKRV